MEDMKNGILSQVLDQKVKMIYLLSLIYVCKLSLRAKLRMIHDSCLETGSIFRNIY